MSKTAKKLDNRLILEGKSPLALSFARLGRNKFAMVSFWILVAYSITAILTSYNIFGIHNSAMDFDLENRYQPMFKSLQYLFGTDTFGRNVLARAIMGARISLFLGLTSGLIMIPIAVVIGSIAGYYGHFLDDIAVYIMSVIVAIPGMLIIMSLVQVMGRSFLIIAFAFAVTGWVGLARVIRGAFFQAREFEYVLAARTLGANDFRIIFKHILPNVFHFVIVSFVLNFVGVIKSEVFLAYVGLSIIGIPSWGNMIVDSKSELMANNWQNLTAATLFMFVFLVSLNIFGDALRDALDPKLKNVS